MIEPLELACCELLLKLYRGARELSVAEFPGFASASSPRSCFDTARYTALKFLDQGAVVCTSTYGRTTETVLDWEQINRHDRWFRQC